MVGFLEGEAGLVLAPADGAVGAEAHEEGVVPVGVDREAAALGGALVAALGDLLGGGTEGLIDCRQFSLSLASCIEQATPTA